MGRRRAPKRSQAQREIHRQLDALRGRWRDVRTTLRLAEPKSALKAAEAAREPVETLSREHPDALVLLNEIAEAYLKLPVVTAVWRGR